MLKYKLLYIICILCFGVGHIDDGEKVREIIYGTISDVNMIEGNSIQGESIKIEYINEIDILDTKNPLYPVYINEHYDYIDINGNIVTDYDFEGAEFFREGRANVKLNGKYGFIDENGNIVIDCVYEETGAFFTEGLCPVSLDGEMWGYINAYGNLIIDYKFQYAWQFSEGLAKVKTSNGYEYIDLYGNSIFAGSTYSGDCHDGMISTSENIYFSVENKEYILSDYARFGEKNIGSFSEGFAVYCVMKENGDYENYYDMNNWDYYYVNQKGEFVSGPYESATPFCEGYAIVMKEGNVYCINSDGDAVFTIDSLNIIPKQVTEMKFSEGMLPFMSDNEKWGFLNSHGEVVIEPQYDWIARNFENDVAVCRKNDEYQLINKQGIIIFETNKLEMSYDINNWWW